MFKLRRRGKQQKATTPTLPFRYNLPEDLEEVKVVAFMQAIVNAILAHQSGQKFTSDAAIHVMAMECARTHEYLEGDGRRGTNNPALFQRVFFNVFTKLFPAIAENLQYDSDVFRQLIALPPDELGICCLLFAKEHLHEYLLEDV